MKRGNTFQKSQGFKNLVPNFGKFSSVKKYLTKGLQAKEDIVFTLDRLKSLEDHLLLPNDYSATKNCVFLVILGSGKAI